MVKTVFTVAHISDLHFSEGTDKDNLYHKHSVLHLRGLEEKIKTINPDFLVVSGDISNNGDSQSLINASSYLYDHIPLGNKEYTGLKFSSERLGVVPGNHDAWNAGQSGSLFERWQRSIKNYNNAFPSHKIHSKVGVYYNWIDCGDSGVYMAFVDSCFLGDTEKYDGSSFGLMGLQGIAKGKISVKQAEKLLEWHDIGVKGQLLCPGKEGIYIDGEKYSSALKILVMHHYLFEPPECKSDYFMRIHHRDVVFRNIAFADFDVLLCGHKHVSSFDVSSYGSHFDKRAKGRYLMNCFRRKIGLHSLAEQIEDDKNRRLTKGLSMVINFFLKIIKQERPELSDSDAAEEVMTLLKNGLQDPDSLEYKAKQLFSEHSFLRPEDRSEFKEIQKRIAVGLSMTERKALEPIVGKITGIVKKLKSRPFLQIISGSTTKACSDGDKERSFDVHRINFEAGIWTLESDRYVWDWNKKSFTDTPLVQLQKFDKTAIF